jgi:DNA-binding response OmpR family regulator
MMTHMHVSVEQRQQGGRDMNLHKPTVFVANSNHQLLRLMKIHLESDGLKVRLASDGEHALEQIELQVPDLILLDRVMPNLDGFHVCQRVREFSAVPIIFIAACGKQQEKVRAFELGADDYLTIPFSVDELLARVRAQLRRVQLTARAQRSPFEGGASLRTITIIGDRTVDYTRQGVAIGERKIALSQREYRLLSALVQRARHIVPQDTLLEYVWGKAYVGDSHLLQVTINRLRRKLEPDPDQPRYILTRVGIGYLLADPF